ncbi:hypothetical protein FRB94_008670 [Tulasnella sp. JGI-2019a]|nr:hypothetical protein FRB93_012232 [Tulasnella sp. JGI-2019a]KAG9011386.1 hypothetical protein FRB94_008670 [Tulasnella sp. JGI-2019a]KAG9035479.1 hypothetical protein FRB95_011185 [Tulasnella sp. JGI-2019a]
MSQGDISIDKLHVELIAALADLHRGEMAQGDFDTLVFTEEDIAVKSADFNWARKVDEV